MKKIKFKVNIFDVALLVIVIAIIVISVLKVNQRKLSLVAKEKQSAEITLVILNEDNKKALDLKKDNSIFDTQSGEELGKITEIDNHHKMNYVPGNGDTFVGIESPAIDGLTVKFKATSKTNSHGTFINSDYYVSPGMKLTFNSNNSKNIVATVDSVVIIK